MKILYITTIGATMAFFQSFIKELILEGHTVDIATNDSERKPPECYYEWGCRVFSLSFSRSPFKKENFQSINQIRKLVIEEKYDIVHCHTPIAAACTRLACRKLRKNQGVKVFYTAHGFHFCNGAPKLNWLIYYPIEKICSRFTDKLITINKEDYGLAKKKFRPKELHYVHGVGINVSEFSDVKIDKTAKRKELDIPEDAFLLLSVGELSERKNHQVIIKAIAKLNNPKIHYAIAGMGQKKEYLLELADSLGISKQIHLLGYRNDIVELNYSADIFCLPSLMEGLGLSAIEGMACGLPIVTSDVHGINDYSENNVTGFKCNPKDTEGFAQAIQKLIENPSMRDAMGKHNSTVVKKYDFKNINGLMKNIYKL